MNEGFLRDDCTSSRVISCDHSVTNGWMTLDTCLCPVVSCHRGGQLPAAAALLVRISCSANLVCMFSFTRVFCGGRT